MERTASCLTWRIPFPQRKDAARFLVYEALTSLELGDKEYLVRINSLESGLGIADLEAIVRTGKAVIRLPKPKVPKMY